MVLKSFESMLSLDSHGLNEERRQKLLNISILAGIIAAMIALVVLFMFIPTGLAGSMDELTAAFYGAIFMLLLSCVAFIINREASTDAAAILWIFTLVLVAMFSDSPQQVVNGRGLFVFAIPIISASFILRPWGSFFAATLSSLGLAILAIQIGGVLPNFFGMIGFYLLALFTWLASRTLEQTLENLRDTNRALAESEYIAQMERRRAELYLDIMAHDIGNKHQAILFASDILESAIDSKELHETLTRITDAIEICSSLRSQVQDIEGLYSEDMRKLSLTSHVRQALNDFSNKYPDVIIHFDEPEGEPFILADRYFDVMVSSLLSNTVMHHPDREVEVWVSIKKKGKSWMLSIADNGKGISPSRKKDLFNPNRRFGGVGLHIVRMIVNKYGGTIEVKDRVPNAPEKGAEFEVLIPEYHEEIQEKKVRMDNVPK